MIFKFRCQECLIEFESNDPAEKCERCKGFPTLIGAKEESKQVSKEEPPAGTEQSTTQETSTQSVESAPTVAINAAKAAVEAAEAVENASNAETQEAPKA